MFPFFKKNILVLFLLTVSPAFAVKISGHVRSATPGVPLEHVNVYLANTMMGDVSDANGYYEISAKPGNYKLVASFMGFKPSVTSVTVLTRDLVQNITLQPQPIEMPEITVSAKESRMFSRQLTLFHDLFIGVTKNAKKCTIKNPEYLNFAEEMGFLIATCDVPLIIRNNALGFEISAVLEKFKWNKLDMGGGYIIHPQFIDLSKDATPEQREKWQAARLQAYRGSSRQFFANIYNNHDAGAFMYRWRNMNDTEFSQWESNCEYFAIIPSSNDDYKMLNIQHDILQVRYRTIETTTLFLKTNMLMIDPYGLVINYDGFSINGYWGTLRMADTLPQDYVPEN